MEIEKHFRDEIMNKKIVNFTTDDGPSGKDGHKCREWGEQEPPGT